MSDGGRIHRPGQGSALEPAHEQDDPQLAPRERGLFGSGRMDAVRAERGEVAANLRNRLAVMRKADGKAKPAAIPEGGGAALSNDVRARMEPRLGADLSAVRVHAGGESADAATALGARAFTVGNDVHFGAGELAPGTKEGDKLLAHELTHVVQGQRSGIQRKPAGEHDHAAGGGGGGGGGAAGHAGGHEVSDPADPAEKEAEAVSEHVAGDLHGGGEAKGGAHGPKNKKPKNAKDKKQKAAGKSAAAAGEEEKQEEEQEESEGKTALAQQQQQGAAAGASSAATNGGGSQAGQSKAPPIAAKLSGLSRKIFRAAPADAAAKGPPAPSAAPNPKAKEIEAEAASVKSPATLDAYNSMVQGLNHLVTAESKASVALRVGKLKDAIARTKPKLTEIYKDKAPAMIADWIDSRLARVNAETGPKFVGKVAEAKEKLVNSPTIDPKLQIDAAKVLTNYGVCAPEEAATDRMMEESGGIMKVFDVGGLWWSMADDYQNAWKTKFPADADKQFVEACKGSKSLVMAPPGMEGKPPFKGASIPTVFNKPLNGFVGQGKDAGAVSNFADAINRFALNPGYYPSKAMFVVSASADVVKQKKNDPASGMKIGKPSMFNLLNFDENVYKEDDRQYGHLADASGKAGNALELTCQGYPGEIFASAKFLG